MSWAINGPESSCLRRAVPKGSRTQLVRVSICRRNGFPGARDVLLPRQFVDRIGRIRSAKRACLVHSSASSNGAGGRTGSMAATAGAWPRTAAIRQATRRSGIPLPRSGSIYLCGAAYRNSGLTPRAFVPDHNDAWLRENPLTIGLEVMRPGRRHTGCKHSACSDCNAARARARVRGSTKKEAETAIRQRRALTWG